MSNEVLSLSESDESPALEEDKSTADEEQTPTGEEQTPIGEEQTSTVRRKQVQQRSSPQLRRTQQQQL